MDDPASSEQQKLPVEYDLVKTSDKLEREQVINAMVARVTDDLRIETDKQVQWRSTSERKAYESLQEGALWGWGCVAIFGGLGLLAGVFGVWPLVMLATLPFLGGLMMVGMAQQPVPYQKKRRMLTANEKARRRFEAAREAAQQIVDPSVRSQTRSAVGELQSIRLFAQHHPDRVPDELSLVTQNLATVLLAGSLIKEISEYKKSRADLRTHSQKLNNLINQERALVRNLDRCQDELRDGVHEACKKLEEIHDDVMALSGKTTPSVDQITALRVKLQEHQDLSTHLSGITQAGRDQLNEQLQLG